MLYLIAALAALAGGPLLHAGAGNRRGLASLLDGLSRTAIPGLVFLAFVPAAVGEGEWAVVLALVAGFLVPVAAERTSQRATRPTHRLALLAGLSGFVVHAALDGAALATLPPDADPSFPLAVVLHRLPVGVAVWWLVTREMDTRAGIGALAALMLGTMGGYLFGGVLEGTASDSGALTLYQAAVAGSLVHVVVHQHGTASSPADRRWEGWGAVLALALLLAVFVVGVETGGSGPAGFMSRLHVLTAESAPALLLAYVCAGLLSAFLPQRSVRWMEQGGGASQAARGMAIGLPFPICSCGVVPLYRSLIRRGAPPAAAMAFLVATPELGLDAVLLSIPLLGPRVTVLRLVTAALVALLVGWWVGGRLKKAERADEGSRPPGETPSTRERLVAALRTGTGEVVDHTAPWIVLGLGVAALVTPFLESGWLGGLPPVADVFLFALLGFPTYVCAASATPLVAAFLATGLSPGAGIAFLITGPATNISTLGLISSLHGRRAAVAFAAVMVTLAVVAGIAVNTAFGTLPVPSLEALTEDPPGLLQLVSLVLLGGLFLGSVVRRGPRRFVGELREGLGWAH
ncbi:MAG: permease [Gemmatimonadota bacterium]|nr:permease [Gemmatimonadota bacterium]MDE2871539.1 permease [Gemmatimonadota bacterium]